MSKSKEEMITDLPIPVGAFILQQQDIHGAETHEGNYYHYSDVCTLMNRYATQQTAELEKEVERLKGYIVKIQEASGVKCARTLMS